MLSGQTKSLPDWGLQSRVEASGLGILNSNKRGGGGIEITLSQNVKLGLIEEINQEHGKVVLRWRECSDSSDRTWV